MEPLYLPQRKNKHSVFPNHTWRVLFCYMQMTVSVFCKKKQAKKRKRHGQIKQSPIWSLCNKHFEIILLFCTDGEKQHQRKKIIIYQVNKTEYWNGYYSLRTIFIFCFFSNAFGFLCQCWSFVKLAFVARQSRRTTKKNLSLSHAKFLFLLFAFFLLSIHFNL